MKLNKALNLVLPIDRADGTTAWIHATPIREETFEAYFLPLSRAYAEIFSQGLRQFAGSRVATLMLERYARQHGEWEGPGGVEAGLLGEIKRLSSVIAPIGTWTPAQPATGDKPAADAMPAGWQPMQFDQAVAQGVLDEGDAKEALAILVFFTMCSWIPFRAERASMVGAMANYWSGRVVSSNSTEFATSLPTSTATGNSGASPQSQVPS